jgi:hypothetical protein
VFTFIPERCSESAPSKKIENHAASVALGYFAYNFIKIHRTLRMSPAMAAGVTGKLWEVSDLVAAWEGVRAEAGKSGVGRVVITAPQPSPKRLGFSTSGVSLMRRNRPAMTDQELAREIANIEAEIDAFGQQSLMTLMDACRASAEQIKDTHGSDGDINRAIDRGYLATIKSILDLAKRRKN